MIHGPSISRRAFILVVSACFFGCSSEPRSKESASPSPVAKPSATSVGLDDMTSGRPLASGTAPADPKAIASFEADLLKAGPTRDVFARHLPALGARPILDVLEKANPTCHGEAHELGRALMALRQDIGAALRECGNGCTSACMHGAVGEAFGGSDIPTISSKMKAFCASSPMRELHPAGNCAHGIGHALMFAANRDVDQALDACHGFDTPGMQHYCATGVYMELLLSPSPPPFGRGSHEPCSTHPEFAAACYRYRGRALLAELGGLDALRQACLAQPDSLRRGCFHGLGTTLVGAVVGDPSLLGRYCASDRVEDRTLCVEGTMEKQADFDRDTARTVCARQTGEIKTLCDSTVSRGMYDVLKPSMPLYVTAAKRPRA